MKHYDNSTVRRQDRLLTQESAHAILENGEFGVLSLIENKNGQIGAYGIPMSYVWDKAERIYFHCATTGHKLDCTASNPMASFCVVGATQVIGHQFTTAYQSVITRGVISHTLDHDEKMMALEMLLDKYSPNDKDMGLKYTAKSLHRTEILRLDIQHISGKAKPPLPIGANQ